MTIAALRRPRSAGRWFAALPCVIPRRFAVALGVALAMLLALTSAQRAAAAVYLEKPLSEILPEGDLNADRIRWSPWAPVLIRAEIDGEGDAFVSTLQLPTGHNGPRLLIELSQARDVSGTIYLPADAGEEQGRQVPFTIPAQAFSAEPAARASFHRLRATHYEILQSEYPFGRAWFRHQAEQSHAIAPVAHATPAPRRGMMDRRTGRGSDEAEMFALLTGGRAVAENLALDDSLPEPTEGEATVAVDGIQGIAAAEINWQAILEDRQPETDALASLIPHDQYALFLPSPAALDAVLAALDHRLLPTLAWTEAGSGAERVLDVYRRQLQIDRLLRGDATGAVRSLAITGSDPYFRTGTDIALVLEVDDPNAWVTRAQALAQEPGARLHAARLGDRAVAITNSPAQLARLRAAADGEAPALGSLDEYRFFRQRYDRGDAETALLIISDATIRRWCGPRWRIASARRTKAISMLARQQAQRLDQPDANPQPIHDDTWGSLAFITPIVEMTLDRVTPDEARAYENWRRQYEGSWTNAFDPIALRIAVEGQTIHTDLTVLPLTVGTQYRQAIDLAGNAAIKPRAGDPHANTALHLVMAIDTQARQMQGWGAMVRGMLGLDADPWAWLDQTVAFYIERDPVWDEIAEQLEDPDNAVDGDAQRIMASMFSRLPIALHADVKSPIRLAAFLTGLRAMIEQSAPGMVRFINHAHQEQPYVEVAATEMDPGEEFEPRLFYLATARVLVVSPSRELIHRTIERHAARAQAPAEGDGEGGQPPVAEPWTGRHLALRLEADVFRRLTMLSPGDWREGMQERAWAAIPALNAWRQRFPDQDPLALHETIWVQTPDPAGAYRWNQAWRTMESVDWGHPGQPRMPEGASRIPEPLHQFKRGELGVTFEHDGLRAKVSVDLAD